MNPPAAGENFRRIRYIVGVPRFPQRIDNAAMFQVAGKWLDEGRR